MLSPFKSEKRGFPMWKAPAFEVLIGIGWTTLPAAGWCEVIEPILYLNS